MVKNTGNKRLKNNMNDDYENNYKFCNKDNELNHKMIMIKNIRINNDYVLVTFLNNNDEIKCLVSLEDYVKFNLKKDEIVSDSILEELQTKEVILKAWRLCIKKLSYADKTKKEISDILYKEKTLDNDQINEILEKLENKGYINDTEYIENHVKKMMNMNDGKNKIIHTLMKKGLTYDSIIQVLDTYDNENEKYKAIRYIEKNEKLLKDVSLKMRKQLLISKLINKGFSLDIAKETVNDFKFNDEDSNEEDALKKAVNKAMKTYSRKYSGYELKKTILNQLIRKGFNYDDILNEIEGMGNFYDEN